MSGYCNCITGSSPNTLVMGFISGYNSLHNLAVTGVWYGDSPTEINIRLKKEKEELEKQIDSLKEILEG